MKEFIYLVVTLMGTGDFPPYFDTAQAQLAKEIIEQAHILNQDPYLLMAIAWKESRLQKQQTSHTGDVGIFQISWKFWGKRVWKYESYRQFVEDMDNPEHATLAAVMVLKEMRLYRTCRGINLFACYNGGPAWMKSKNIKTIQAYARATDRYHRRFKRYKSWGKKNRGKKQ